MGSKARKKLTALEASNRRIANLTILDLQRLGITLRIVPREYAPGRPTGETE